jgi:hypothetical protein
MVQISFTNCRTIFQIVLGAIWKIALQSVKQTHGFLEPCRFIFCYTPGERQVPGVSSQKWEEMS